MADSPRTLEQIIASLGSIYDPQVNSIRTQQQALPGQQATDEAQLDAKRQQGYDDIMGQARARGVGFGGIPLGEQAKYQATEYLPAVAKLRTAYKQQATTLEDYINQINEKRSTQAQGIFETERDFFEKQRQFNEQMAAARAAAAGGGGGGGGYSFGGGSDFSGGGGGAPQGGGSSQGARYIKRFGDGGYNFQDASGKPISAAQFYAIKGLGQQGISWRGFLQSLAQMGDKGAAQMLGFVGDDMGYDKKKVNSSSLANLYNSFMWGTPHSASYSAPAPSYKAPSGSGVLNLISKR